MATKKKAENKSISTTVSIWPKANGEICLRVADMVMSTVSPEPSSKRYHEHLYRQLQFLLAQR
jgi:hypothetical protein